MALLRERLCKQVYAPPYVATGAKAFGFILQGDATAIRTRVIEPSLANDFVPASVMGLAEDLFALAWIHYDGLASKSPPDDSKGTFAYDESVLLNLVQDSQDRTPYIYIPSLYMNKSVPITSGRDVFGFPKAWGEVDMSSIVPGPQAIHLSTHGDEVANFSLPSEQSQSRLVYEAFTNATAMSRVQLTSRSPGTAYDDLFKHLDSHPDLIKAKDDKQRLAAKMMLGLLAFQKAPMIFLKQVPSAEPPLNQAIYQAYVKAQATLVAITAITLLDGFTVRLQNWASAPIASAYGVAAGAALMPLLSFYIDMDCEIGTGIETPI